MDRLLEGEGGEKKARLYAVSKLIKRIIYTKLKYAVSAIYLSLLIQKYSVLNNLIIGL